jgi:F5/8 type C domain-containing protein/alpha-galactosidase-like protein
MQRRHFVVAGAAAVVVLGVALATAAQSAPATTPTQIKLSASPAHVQVVGLPCLPGALTVGMTNTGSGALYADMELSAPRPLTLDRRVFSSWLPAVEPDQPVTVKVGVTVPRDAKPGNYAVDLNVERQRLTVPVQVLPLPLKGSGDNLLLGEQASASSTNGSFGVCGAVDGDGNSDHWSTSTGWNDGTKSVFPDDYSVTLPAATSIGRVVLDTLDSAKYPAAKNGLRDYDVQAHVGGAWVTVASVRGNVAGRVTSTFAPVTAGGVQIVALDSNDHGYSRIVELAAYSS